MAKDLIAGLVWHEGTLEWTTLQKAKDRLKVVDSGQASIRLEPGDAGPGAETAGEASPPQADTATERIRAGTRDLEGDVAVGLASDQLLIRVVSLPSAVDDELGGMVQLQVDKFSPFPVESLVISYEVLETKEDASLVLIACVKKDDIDSLEETLGKAGIFPARADAVILGRLRLLQDAGEISPEGRQLVLFADEVSAEMMVLEKGVPTVFRSLGSREGVTEAEFTGELAREVGQTLISLELEHGSSECGVVVWQQGGCSGTLADELARACSCKVETRSADDLPPVSEGLARRMAPGARRLDLTPPDWRSAAQARDLKHKMLMAVGCLGGIWLLGAAVLWGGLAWQRARLAALEATQQEWTRPAMAVRAMRRRVSIIKPYTYKAYSALECLREISALQPPGVDLVSFSYRQGEGVKVSAEAGDSKQMYEFKKELDKSELFTGVGLGSHSLMKKKWRFDLDLALPGDDV